MQIMNSSVNRLPVFLQLGDRLKALANFAELDPLNARVVLRVYGVDALPKYGEDAEVAIQFPRTAWEFPQSRFVEYDNSDLHWARKLGFGAFATKFITVKAIGKITDGLVIGSCRFPGLLTVKLLVQFYSRIAADNLWQAVEEAINA